MTDLQLKVNSFLSTPPADAPLIVSAQWGKVRPVIMAMIARESNWNPWLERFEPAFQIKYLLDPPVKAEIELFVKTCGFEVSFQTEQNGRAISRGLMQVIGQSVRELGYNGPLGMLFDPIVNVTWGLRLLAKKFQQCGNDPVKTLLAWNGGGNPNYPAEVLQLAQQFT